MNAKVLRGRDFKGVLAQRFHTLVYTQDSIWVFGLNAGQLGIVLNTLINGHFFNKDLNIYENTCNGLSVKDRNACLIIIGF